ncbi:hypothetical protein Pelo_4254 [Pelomyxa schiedti]|nr:hypothetical protein Pelo_4254 [Pelomyxa schiedti]
MAFWVRTTRHRHPKSFFFLLLAFALGQGGLPPPTLSQLGGFTARSLWASGSLSQVLLSCFEINDPTCCPFANLYNQQILHQSLHSSCWFIPDFSIAKILVFPLAADSTYLYCHEVNPCYSPVASLQAGHLNLPGGDPISNFIVGDNLPGPDQCLKHSPGEVILDKFLPHHYHFTFAVPALLTILLKEGLKRPSPSTTRRCYTGCHIEYGPILHTGDGQQTACSPSNLPPS